MEKRGLLVPSGIDEMKRRWFYWKIILKNKWNFCISLYYCSKWNFYLLSQRQRKQRQMFQCIINNVLINLWKKLSFTNLYRRFPICIQMYTVISTCLGVAGAKKVNWINQNIKSHAAYKNAKITQIVTELLLSLILSTILVTHKVRYLYNLSETVPQKTNEGGAEISDLQEKSPPLL